MKHYVYILKSQKDPKQFYVGYTTNLENRMEAHANPEPRAYTRQYAPWKLETYILFQDKLLAQQFEIYLKSHSGRAFLTKRLITKT
jgi:predicted GIY-YIG superfamily endonuclease